MLVTSLRNQHVMDELIWFHDSPIRSVILIIIFILQIRKQLSKLLRSCHPLRMRVGLNSGTLIPEGMCFTTSTFLFPVMVFFSISASTTHFHCHTMNSAITSTCVNFKSLIEASQPLANFLSLQQVNKPNKSNDNSKQLYRLSAFHVLTHSFLTILWWR